VHFHFKDYRKTGKGFEHVAFGDGDAGFEKLSAMIVSEGDEKCISLEPEVEREGSCEAYGISPPCRRRLGRALWPPDGK
jgi:sugar phosphate isomerase/epimerase